MIEEEGRPYIFRNKIRMLIENVNINAKRARPHYFRHVSEYMNAWLPNKWIERKKAIP